jgi:hypothetical protein
MPRRSAPQAHKNEQAIEERVSFLERPDPVSGVAGPGRWLIGEFASTAPFSLKVSSATSSVGRTLVIPTPYAIKMALVDGAFRAGLPEAECAETLRALTKVDVRIAPAPETVVTHTFVKVRQESRDADPLRPYGATIAYRELAYLSASTNWAFDLATAEDTLVTRIPVLLAHISYIGKRGSFVRFVRLFRAPILGPEYTQPVNRTGTWSPPPRAHIASLDDFGPDADLETLSSFTAKRPRRDRHRRFVETIIPVGIVNTGPGFTRYSRE